MTRKSANFIIRSSTLILSLTIFIGLSTVAVHAQPQIEINPARRSRPATNSRLRGTASVTVSPAGERREVAKDKRAGRPDDLWQVIHLGDQRIGYTHTVTETLKPDGDAQSEKIVRTTSDTKMNFRRFGQDVHMESRLVTDEAENGDLLAFSLRMKNSPTNTTTSTGTVDGRKLRLETVVAKRPSKKVVDWEPGTKSPAWQDRLLRTDPPRQGTRIGFNVYLPELARTTDVRISADDMQQTKLADGENHRLLRVRVTQTILPRMPMKIWVDDDGRVMKTESDVFGKPMVAYTVSAEEALEEINGGELDLAVNSLVKVRPINSAHRLRQITYRIKVKGENPADFLVHGGTQRVRQVDDETVELTVFAFPIPDRPSPAKADPEYLKPARYLESDDARVQEHVRRAAGGETDHARIAVKMERYVHDRLTEKNFSTALASAAEVARTMEGDCTEHAVLLAAMLRAKGVPSRIAVGMVYIPNRSAFGGHMWTEALLGDRWVPLDATLAAGGIGPAHIKLAESSFNDDAPAPVLTFLPLLKVVGKMEIDVVDVR